MEALKEQTANKVSAEVAELKRTLIIEKEEAARAAAEAQAKERQRQFDLAEQQDAEKQQAANQAEEVKDVLSLRQRLRDGGQAALEDLEKKLQVNEAYVANTKKLCRVCGVKRKEQAQPAGHPQTPIECFWNLLRLRPDVLIDGLNGAATPK